MTVFVDKLSSGIGARINKVQKKVDRKELESSDREPVEEHFAAIMEKALAALRRKVEARLRELAAETEAEKERAGQKQLPPALFNLPDDPEFWATAKEGYLDVIAKADPPVGATALMAGGAAEAASLGLAVDFDLVNQQVLQAAGAYTDEWWQNMEKTTRDGLRTAIQSNIATGAPLKGLIKDIEPLFGKGRASSIAATETTRLYAEGNRFAYASAGIQQVEWRTVRDACILQGTAKVSTLEGLKAIKDVEVGDYVLTHQDRYRKVLEVYKRRYEGDVVSLVLRAVHPKNLNALGVTVTLEHPILVERTGEWVWVPAKDLKDSDLVCVAGTRCVDCGKVIVAEKVRCTSCWSKETNARAWASPGAVARRQQIGAIGKITGRQNIKAAQQAARAPAAIARMAETKRRQCQDPAVIERMRSIGRRWGQSPNHPGNRMTEEEKTAATKRMLSARAKKAYGGSFLERKVKWFLDQNQIPYEQQWFFWWTFEGERKRGFADFYFPGPRLVIECDGNHTHNGQEAYDAARDSSVRELGLEVLRFSEDAIRYRFAEVASAIQQRCCITTVGIKEIRRYTLKPRRLGGPGQVVYNLDIEEDSSYVVNGIVVHNSVDPLCDELNGQRWPLGQEQYVPPRHVRCRCRLLPRVDDTALEHPTDLDWDPVNDAASRRRFKEQGNLYATEIEQRVGKGTPTRIGQAEAMKADVQKRISARSGLSAKRTNEFIKTWAVTSGDNSLDSVALQHVASVKFGIEPTAFMKNRIEAFARGAARDIPEETGNWTDVVAEATKFLDAVYAETQEMLARWGVTELYLGRGMGGPEFTGLSAVQEYTARRYQNDYSESIDFRSNPLSSWSINAPTFSTWDVYAVLAKIPVSRIISTPFTGFGALNEYEFVVAGGLDTLRLFSYPPKSIFT